MALPDFSMRQLLEAGAHFGHQTHRWNPKMERYIFGSRSNIHIIDLSQSIPLLHQALVKVREVAASGGRILFVGTKRQASEPIATAARRCAQYYVNHRWLGGTLTNWRTISGSIARLRELEGLLDGLAAGQAAMGVDLGAAVNPPEPALRKSRGKPAPAAEPAPEAESPEMAAATEELAATAEDSNEVVADIAGEPTEAVAE